MYFNDSRILGDTLDTTIRKSKSTWLYKDDPIIMKIMVKISGIVKLPIENAEALQVVKYEPSGYYNEHHDSCCDGHHLCTEFIKRGGQRIKAVLIYLNDEFTEGATNFPVLNKKFKPPKYSAVVFNPFLQTAISVILKQFMQVYPLRAELSMLQIYGLENTCLHDIWFNVF